MVLKTSEILDWITVLFTIKLEQLCNLTLSLWVWACFAIVKILLNISQCRIAITVEKEKLFCSAFHKPFISYWNYIYAHMYVTCLKQLLYYYLQWHFGVCRHMKEVFSHVLQTVTSDSGWCTSTLPFVTLNGNGHMLFSTVFTFWCIFIRLLENYLCLQIYFFNVTGQYSGAALKELYINDISLIFLNS